MPNALRVFLGSLLFGVLGGYGTLRVGTWVVERWFSQDPLAFAVTLLATGAVGVASAVTAGVMLGKRDRDAGKA
jgi:hypothetical protein